MIYITGDTHGDPNRFTLIQKKLKLTEADTLIVAGDFGCIFGLGERDEMKLDLIAALPYTVLFLDGNHECFPAIYGYPEEDYCGGRVHRIRHNILHLMRGQVFTLDGKTVFTMGGGFSLDYMLRTPGRSWWPEEMPSREEYDAARKNLALHHNRVDYIISHAASMGTMQFFLDTGIFTRIFPQESELNNFLQEVRTTVEHTHSYFGHLHMDAPLPDHATALYWDVYDLFSGNKVLTQADLHQ